MLKVTATQFKKNLSGYLDLASQGDTIIIERNKKSVARLVPVPQSNWRDKISITPEILVSAEELVKPIEDIWEGCV